MPIVHYRPPNGSPPLVFTHSGRQYVVQPPDRYWTSKKIRHIVGVRSDKLDRPITDKDAPEHRRFMFTTITAWQPSESAAHKDARPDLSGESQVLLPEEAIKELNKHAARHTTTVLIDRDTRSESDDVFKTEQVTGLHTHLINEVQLQEKHREGLEAVQRRLADERAETERRISAELDSLRETEREEVDRIRASAREAAEARRREFEMEELEKVRAETAAAIQKEQAGRARKAAKQTAAAK